MIEPTLHGHPKLKPYFHFSAHVSLICRTEDPLRELHFIEIKPHASIFYYLWPHVALQGGCHLFLVAFRSPMIVILNALLDAIIIFLSSIMLSNLAMMLDLFPLHHYWLHIATNITFSERLLRWADFHYQTLFHYLMLFLDQFY